MMKNELEVEALPTDLPDHIEVDISVLTEVGSTIHAKDLKFDRSKVTVEISDDEVIATIQEPVKEPEPEIVPEEAVTTPATESPEPTPEKKEDKKA